MIRPLEASARAKGVRFLLNYKMTSLIREPSAEQKAGRVIGITAQYTPRILPGATAPLKSFRSDGNIESTKPTMNLRATKAVIVATGGSTSNINFRRMVALTLKSASLTRIAGTLVETYLGRDAGRKVLGGRIGRGVADRIEAVLWFSDLRNYTRISDSADPEQIIPLLNEYAGAILSAIHEHEGDVLKLIGDGTLAIFTAADRASACHAALTAALGARRAVTLVNERRIAASLPTTDMYLGLHVGEVFYGNIGSEERLDFTVVGPAVNEVSRIASMCRSLDQPVLISSAFASAIDEPKKLLVSVGRYALRGVERPQSLFTVDREFVPFDRSR